jgi:hypothetical protein
VLTSTTENNATLTTLFLGNNNIGDEGARALAAALDNNATLTRLDLDGNNIGAEGARALAAALDKNATLTTLFLGNNNIGDEGARALAAALDTNHTLQVLDLGHDLYDDGVTADITNLVADRLRVNKLALKVPAWIVSAAAKVAEVPIILPPGIAQSIAEFAFGFIVRDRMAYDAVARVTPHCLCRSRRCPCGFRRFPPRRS